MNSFWMPKKQPLYMPMLSTFGGGSARGFGRGLGGGGSPFENMSNFPGATQISDTLIVYLSPGSYNFTDPTGGSATYKAYVVGGGGGSDGDGGGWYGATGAGGGGGAVGEFSSSVQMKVGVGYGGEGLKSSGADWIGYQKYSIEQSISATDESRRRGRGGTSYISEQSSGNVYLYGTGGMPGAYGYYSTIDSEASNNGPSNIYAYNNHNGGRNRWYNGGYGVTSGYVSSGNTHYGGYGGCAAHKDASTNSNVRHPNDLYNSNPAQGEYSASAGENTTYSGPGGGGGSDVDNSYNGNYAAGAAGGTASGLNSLLSGTSYSSAGGNGSNYSSQGAISTQGTIGGGAGANSRYHTSVDTWNQDRQGGSGAVFLEWVA